jgi:predicted AlkP superfamily pyrophosphatase or phosphodiesterase
MRFAFLLIGCLMSVATMAQDTTQYITWDRTNSPAQEKKPYVILISADGFRYDLADKYQATNLLKLRSQGVQAEYMYPSYPSLTFPNHYSIVTGMYPAHHGLVDNYFYDTAKKSFYVYKNAKTARDSSYYGGTPLWVLAEQNKMLSASFYWVGSEAAIQGIRPTYYYHYNEAIPVDDRIEIIKDWLQLPEDRRPHLITVYFPQVDHAEHSYGPDAWQTKAAVQQVDQAVGKLVDAVNALDLPVNFIFVSDHGMTTVDTAHALRLPEGLDTNKFIVTHGEALLHLYAKDKADIKPQYQILKAEAKDFDVYLAADLPSRWHYGKKDDVYGRVGDIVIVPHLPHFFNIDGFHAPYGQHGFDPAIPEMHATFYAWGPAFKSGEKIKAFENVHVFPLVTKILGLPNPENIDGRTSVLQNTLR